MQQHRQEPVSGGQWNVIHGVVQLTGWERMHAPQNGSLLICPRCHGVVFDAPGLDSVSGHERWHSSTDFPIPVELAQ